jgi:pSer/pThr/pTyr-binding forkhead associated (FHA) protein
MLELVFDDDGATRRMPIRDGLTLGRASDNDLVLRDFSVSRRHARLAGDGAVFRIVDLRSTNGIKINGTLVTDGVLHPGDRVAVYLPGPAK